LTVVGGSLRRKEALGWSNDAIQVVVMDIQMRLNGIQGTALIKRVPLRDRNWALRPATEGPAPRDVAAGASSVLSKERAGALLREEITTAVDYRSAMLS
jgi:hypothetical protein